MRPLPSVISSRSWMVSHHGVGGEFAMLMLQVSGRRGPLAAPRLFVPPSGERVLSRWTANLKLIAARFRTTQVHTSPSGSASPSRSANSVIAAHTKASSIRPDVASSPATALTDLPAIATANATSMTGDSDVRLSVTFGRVRKAESLPVLHDEPIRGGLVEVMM